MPPETQTATSKAESGRKADDPRSNGEISAAAVETVDAFLFGTSPVADASSSYEGAEGADPADVAMMQSLEGNAAPAIPDVAPHLEGTKPRHRPVEQTIRYKDVEDKLEAERKAKEEAEKVETEVEPTVELGAEVEETAPVEQEATPVEPDELAFLREQNAKMMAMINEMAGQRLSHSDDFEQGLPSAVPPAQEVVSAPSPSSNAQQAAPAQYYVPQLTEELFDQVMRDKETFSAYIGAQVQHAVQEARRGMIPMVTSLMHTLKETDNFFLNNPDIRPVEKLVKDTAAAIDTNYRRQNIVKSPTEILDEAARGLRERLNLTRAAQSASTPKGGAPNNQIAMPRAKPTPTQRNGGFAPATGPRKASEQLTETQQYLADLASVARRQ